MGAFLSYEVCFLAKSVPNMSFKCSKYDRKTFQTCRENTPSVCQKGMGNRGRAYLKHFWISCSSLSTLLFLFSSCHIPSFSSFFPFSLFLVPSSFLVPFYSSLASSSASTVPSSSSPVPPSFPIPPLFPFSHSFSSFSRHYLIPSIWFSFLS